MYDIEDEVDWSDGTLASPPPLTMGPSLQSPAAYATDQANDFQLASQTKSPGLHVHLQNVIDGKSSTSTAVPQDPFILASNSTQRPPLSHEDVSRFALYQANQKTYEALFLRTYVSQALDPQKLDLQNSLTDNPGLLPALRDYLKTVTHNVNSLTDKMIWNAHFKCVNFLAAGRDIGLPFVNVDGLKADTFEGFGPGNPYPVVDLMNQSWHLTDCRLNMVQYCGEDYPIEHEGKGRSPFDELQETRRELSHCPPNSGMPPGRIIQYPLGQITNGNAVPKAAVVGENDMEAKPLAPVPQSRRRAPNRKTDQNKYASVKKRSAVKTSKVRARSGPVSSTKAIPESKAQALWPTKVYNALKDRLAMQRSGPARCAIIHRDIKSVVTWAVSNNVIERPPAHVQNQIDRTTSTNAVQSTSPISHKLPSPSRTGGKRKNRRASGSRKKKPRTMLGVDRPLEDVNNGHAEASSQSPSTQSSQSNPGAQAELVGRGEGASFPTHPSGSTTLEPHQLLPPGAYFDKQHEDEELAWRCGIRHCLGHYYIAGDRRSCPGCNTNFKNSRKTRIMDFYMPSKEYFTQPAPDIIWKPSPMYKKQRKDCNLSHNSVGKDAYWAAIASGRDEERAQQSAAAAIQDYMERKSRVVEPDQGLESDHTSELEYEPEPEPEPIKQPHPSGSKTMEHGQDIPEGHYFSKQHRHEEFAWRCDVGHALGRYYMAGDKKSCPGCGSNKAGPGRRTEMDFYLPPNTVISQEAPGLVTWRPRKPYNVKPRTKKQSFKSHNQLCSGFYWDAIENGVAHEEALDTAITELNVQLDARDAMNQVESDAPEGSDSDGDTLDTQQNNSVNDCLEKDESVNIEHAGVDSEDVVDDILDAYNPGSWGQTADGGPGEKIAISVSTDSSEDDASSSGSDSE